ncbi:MAG: PAS domain S-box protein [Gemmatimonadetes bacterium]|nr:PAS domain S-box protein [Gemmatimonadota bacterium]
MPAPTPGRAQALEGECAALAEALRQSDERLRAILDNTSAVVYLLDDQGRYLFVNRQWESLFHRSRERVAGQTLWDVWPKEFADALHAGSREVLRSRKAMEREELLPHDDGVHTYLSLRIPLFGSTRAPYAVCGISTDITDTKKAETLRVGLNWVLDMIVTGDPLEDVLTSLLRLIESQSQGMLCSILLLDEDGRHLRHGAAPSLPEAYMKAIDGEPIGPRAGSCGTAVYRREPVIVTDIQEDPLWADYRELAAQHGLRACWSTPIISYQGKVLGTFAMYYREARSPSLAEKRLIGIAPHIAGIAIEHKRANEALRESERRFRGIFDSALVGIHLADLKSGADLINAAYLRMIGCSAEEFCGLATFDALTHPEDRDADRARFEEMLAGKVDHYQADKRYVLRDRRVVWANLTVSLLRDASGEARYALGMAVDVTERKRAEEQAALLQEVTMDVAQAEDLASALAVVLGHVCEKTGWALGQAWVPRDDGSALECSPAWCTTSGGLERFRAISQGFTFPPGIGLPGRVWSGKEAAWILDVTLDANFPRATYAHEVGLKAGLGIPILAGDQVIAVLEFFLREARAEDERLVGVITAVAAQLGVAIQRKWAEEALRRSEERFRALVEHSTDVIILLGRDGIIRYDSQSLSPVLGYSPEESLGRSVFELIHPDDAPGVRRLFAEVLDRPGHVVRTEARGLHKDGSWRHLEAAVVNRLSDPAVGAIVVNSRDITARKEAERLQTATYRIAQAAAAAPGLQELLLTIHAIVGDLMPAQNFYIALHDAGTGTVSFPYWADERDPSPPARRLARGLTEYVLRTGSPLHATPDVVADLQRRGEVVQIGTRHFDWLGIPLAAHQETIGALVVQSYSESIRFGGREEEILRFVSTQVAMAIERKRAEEALRESVVTYRSLTPDALARRIREVLDRPR